MEHFRRRMLWMSSNVRFFVLRKGSCVVEAGIRMGRVRSRVFAAGATLAMLLSVASPLALQSAPLPGGDADIKILRSDNRGVLLEYRPRPERIDTILIGQETYLAIRIAETIPSPRRGTSGGADLHCRFLPLAFPSASGHTVRLVAADYEEFRGMDLLPDPTDASLPVVDGNNADRTGSAQQPSPGLLPDEVVDLYAPDRVRSMLLGGVRAWPVQVNQALHTVRLYTRMVVEVTFGSGSTISVDVQDAERFAGAVLNHEALRSWQGPSLALARRAATPSVLASGDWYRITVSEDGIYRIDAQYLAAAGISLAGVDPRTIRLYGNGGAELSEDVRVARPQDLWEIAIYVEGESDGQFGTADYILFYGASSRGWRYDPAAKSLRHLLHHYSDVNYYWLTFSGVQGRRMADQPSSTAPASLVVEKFTDALVVEEEKVNKLGSGKDWYGQSLSGPSSSFTHVNILPGLVPNETITYRYTLVAHDETFPRFTVRDGSTVLGTYSLPPVYQYLYATANTFQATGTSSLASNTSQFNVAFASNSSAAEAWIDWVEILYPRMLWAVNNSLRFRTPDAQGIAEYRLQQFTSRPMIFNVTDHANVRLVSGVTGSYVFRDTVVAGSINEYWATAVGAWKAPGAIQKMSNQNLRGYADGADFIILTSAEFRSAADRLKSFREQAAYGGFKTLVVDVAQIYNEFGGGLPDITAVRDFLKFAYDTWTPRPTFVLFFGGASYDYKSILGTKSSYVPTWQTAESRDDIGSYATDDFFAKFSSGNAISLVLGRISSRTPAEANTVVDKIIRYEQSAGRDSWKMRMLYIGDDAWTPENGEVGDRTIHSDDAETLANPFYTPEEFEKRKVYLAEYPTVFTAQGRRKPGAAAEIINLINQGVLVVNYSGHGNPKVWAHESIFEVTTSIPQLLNSDRLSLFFLATCNFSQFDDPKNYTGSELLMNKPDGGAVGVISATRKVYASGNAALNQGTYRRLFVRDAYGRVAVERPATALFLYKASGSNFENDQKFFYMGDPTTRLAYPRGYATIDSINGEAVDSVGGVPRTTPVTLKALSQVRVSGTVRDQSNQVDASFNGVLSLQINDVTRQVLIVGFYPGVNWPYASTGGTIYRGSNSVVNGRYRAIFVVPKDISYADSTGRGRLVAYFSNAQTDGAGFTNALRIGGTDSTASDDREGPVMRIYLDSRSFRQGDLVSEKPLLLVDLRDSNGVNTSTAGIGHRIEAWINSSVQSKDLTEYYSSTLDDYRAGTVQYPLSSLSAGKNTVKVRAWDSYNNSAMAETFFEVASSDRLTITDVFNYPNPFSSETLFTFRHNQNQPLDVEVRIYTLAGRLVQTLARPVSSDPMVRVPWDGRDRDGDVLANGVYLYKLVVRSLDGRFASEALGKLTVLR